MRRAKLSLVLGLVVAAWAGGALAGDNGSPRQFYSGWRKHSKHDYHYRQYFFKPKPDFNGFKHHFAIRPKRDPKHLYFYNQHKKQFWGRCPINAKGESGYSLLAEKDRKAKLSEIPESAFPKPGELPPIPESTDGATLDLPPDDLPADEPDTDGE